LIVYLISNALPATASPLDSSNNHAFTLAGFSYNYDTYVWTDSLDVRRVLGKRTVVGLNGGLFATQISSTDGLTRRQRFISGRLNLDHQLSSRWSAGLTVSQQRQKLEEVVDRHYVFSDILTRLQYSISSGVDIAQETGFIVAARSAQSQKTKDQGITSITRVNVVDRQWLKRSWQAGGSVEVRALSHVPSVEGRWQASTTGEMIFGDSLSVVYGDQAKQTRYFPLIDSFGTIARQRLRDGYFTADSRGTFGPATRWSVAANYAWRRESYALIHGEMMGASALPQGLDRTDSGYHLRGSQDLGERGQIGVRYRYQETSEDFGRDVKDQDAFTGELEISGMYRFTPVDSVNVRVLWKVVSFEVPPDSAFFVDRDLATRLADISWTHEFDQIWTAGISFSYRGLRQVYISGDWSANNNHNDIYLLMPRIQWRPSSSSRINQTYRIQANYVSYDTEKGYAQPERSTLYRRGESETSMHYQLIDPLAAEGRFLYRYEDFGPLIWREKWNQQVSWDRRSYLVRVGFEVTPHPAWKISPAMSYLEKRSFNHEDDAGESVRRPKSTLLRRTWELQAVWLPSSGRDDLAISGSRRIQHSTTGMKDTSDWVEITYRRYW